MGRGGAKAPADSTTAAPKEVLIDGQFYDVADFEKRHPGGSVLKLYMGNGIDATEAYDNFHVRSKKARTVLASIKHRPAGTQVEQLAGQSALMADFTSLTQELTKEGFFKPAPLHVLLRVAEIVLMHAAGLYLLLCTKYMAAGIALLGLVSGRCGWLMHEGGHYSLTGHIPTDRALQVGVRGRGSILRVVFVVHALC